MLNNLKFLESSLIHKDRELNKFEKNFQNQLRYVYSIPKSVKIEFSFGWYKNTNNACFDISAGDSSLSRIIPKGTYVSLKAQDKDISDNSIYIDPAKSFLTGNGKQFSFRCSYVNYIYRNNKSQPYETDKESFEPEFLKLINIFKSISDNFLITTNTSIIYDANFVNFGFLNKYIHNKKDLTIDNFVINFPFEDDHKFGFEKFDIKLINNNFNESINTIVKKIFPQHHTYIYLDNALDDIVRYINILKILKY